MIDVEDNNAAYYYHFDGLGSVVALSDSNGDSCQSYEYSAYGQVAASNPNFLANPYLFTGRRFDIETGLYYYRARYYNPHIGRFMQTDPVGYGAGINWYLYCGNNPVGMVDPSGEFGLILKWHDSYETECLEVAIMSDEGALIDTRCFTSWLEYERAIGAGEYDDVMEELNTVDFYYVGDCLSTWDNIVNSFRDAIEATEGYRMVAGAFAIAIGGDVFKLGLASQNYPVAGIGIGLVAGGSALVITDPVAWEIWAKAHNIWEEAGVLDYYENVIEEEGDETGY